MHHHPSTQIGQQGEVLHAVANVNPVDQSRTFEHFRLDAEQLCGLRIHSRNYAFRIEAELDIPNGKRRLHPISGHLNGLLGRTDAARNQACNVKSKRNNRTGRAAGNHPAILREKKSEDERCESYPYESDGGFAACEPDFKR